MVKLLKAAIPSTGWWNHHPLATYHKMSLPLSPLTQYPRTQGNQEKESDFPSFIFPKSCVVGERAGPEDKHRNFRHSENKYKCCPK